MFVHKLFCVSCICIITISLVLFPSIAVFASGDGDIDSFEVSPSSTNSMNKWNVTKTGSDITTTQKAYFHEINSTANATSTILFERGLRDTSLIAKTKLMFIEELLDYNTTEGWDNYNPIFEEDFETTSIWENQWVTQDGFGNSIAGVTSNEAHLGTYGYEQTGGEFPYTNQSAGGYFESIGDFRFTIWVFQDQSGENMEHIILYTSQLENASTNEIVDFEPHYDFTYPYTNTEVKVTIEQPNGTGKEIILYNEASAECQNVWVGYRFDIRNTTGEFLAYMNINDVGWSQVANISGLYIDTNVSCLHLGSSVSDFHYDDISILPYNNELGSSGDYSFEFYMKGNNGEKAGIKLTNENNGTWYAYYSNDNTIVQTTITNADFEIEEWYILEIWVDLYKTELDFVLRDKYEQRLWDRDYTDFYVLQNLPGLLESNNLTYCVVVSVFEYVETSCFWWEWAAAPFQEQRFIMDTSSPPTEWQTYNTYGFIANGTSTSSVWYRNRIEHFQAFSGLASYEVDFRNGSVTESSTIQLLLRDVQSDGSNDGNVLSLSFTAQKLLGSTNSMYVILSANSPFYSITKVFSTSVKSSIGFLFWKQESTRQMRLKVSLYDELNQTQKVILALSSEIKDNYTNEYEIWLNYSYLGLNDDSTAIGAIYDTNIIRSRKEQPEPSLPWPSAPPTPIPPYIPIISEIMMFIVGVISTIQQVIDFVGGTVYAMVEGWWLGTIEWGQGLLNEFMTFAGELIAVMMEPFVPLINSIQTQLEPYITFLLNLVEITIFYIVTFSAGFILPFFYQLMIALTDPTTYWTLGAIFTTFFVCYILGPSVLHTVGWAVGVSDLDLGYILESPFNRLFMLINFIFTLYNIIYNIAMAVYTVIIDLLKLIPFL